MNTEQQALKAELIAEAQTKIADMERSLSAKQNVLFAHSWVVLSADNLALMFMFDQHKTATGARVCGLLDAPLFTREDAENLAANTFNGNNLSAKAVYITDALTMCIERQRAFVKMLEDLPN